MCHHGNVFDKPLPTNLEKIKKHKSLSREISDIRNWIKTLELKNIVTKIKNSLEGEMKPFSDKGKLREFITSGPTLENG